MNVIASEAKGTGAKKMVKSVPYLGFAGSVDPVRRFPYLAAMPEIVEKIKTDPDLSETLDLSKPTSQTPTVKATPPVAPTNSPQQKQSIPELKDLKVELEKTGEPISFERVVATPGFPKLSDKALSAMRAEWMSPGPSTPDQFGDKQKPINISQPKGKQGSASDLATRQAELTDWLESTIKNPNYNLPENVDFKTLKKQGELSGIKETELEKLKGTGADFVGDFIEKSRENIDRKGSVQGRRSSLASDVTLNPETTVKSMQGLGLDPIMDLDELLKSDKYEITPERVGTVTKT